MLQTETVEDTLVVRPEGKITVTNADQFRQELNELVEQGHLNLTIDLANVDIIDSKGLGVFVVCYKALGEKNGTLTVVTDNEDFQKLFHVMRLDEHFMVRASS